MNYDDIKPGTMIHFTCVKDNNSSIYDNVFGMTEELRKEFRDLCLLHGKYEAIRRMVSKLIEKEIVWIKDHSPIEYTARSWAEKLQNKLIEKGDIGATVSPVYKEGKMLFQITLPKTIETISYPVKIVYYSKNKKRKNIRNRGIKQIKRILKSE